jgi:hypothetical protein
MLKVSLQDGFDYAAGYMGRPRQSHTKHFRGGLGDVGLVPAMLFVEARWCLALR